MQRQTAVPEPSASRVWGSARNHGLPLPLKSPDLGHEIDRTRFNQHVLALLPILNTQAVSDQSRWLLPKVPSSGYGIPSLKDKSGTSHKKSENTDRHACMHKHTVAAMLAPTSLPTGLELSTALPPTNLRGLSIEVPCPDGDTRPREVKS